MTDPSPEWVDELRQEVRRAGRAAVAARAAAEAVEERLERPAGSPSPEDELLAALMPALDALARMAAGAAPSRPEPKGWLDRLRRPRGDAELRALREAVAMLDAQVVGALESRGITIDREVGCAVDPERHRVVDTRAGARSGLVARVLRAGYRRGASVLRVADVVATR